MSLVTIHADDRGPREIAQFEAACTEQEQPKRRIPRQRRRREGEGGNR